MLGALTGNGTRICTLLAVAGAASFVAACGMPTWSSSLHEPSGPSPVSDSGRWLKVHGFQGELYVLESWQVPDAIGPVTGSGVLFDADREVLDQGAFTISRDSIALLETNDRELVSTFALSGLSVFTTLATAATVACLADPKSCFGSCPTFYESLDGDRPLAEGFSSSFARALEARDVDHLGLTRPPGPFSLVMRNEAQETHAVRKLQLLAVPSEAGTEVLMTAGGHFHRAARRYEPVACVSEDGSCLGEVTRRDDVELASVADPTDLARREEVVLDFGPISGPVGLVLTARHSFVSTYVFYQALAYGGSEVGSVLAALERGEPGVKDRVLGMPRELGGIEVMVRIGDRPYTDVGTFEEAGPIAADQQLFEIGDAGGNSVQVRLRMARGSWRIDEATLAHLSGRVEPVVLRPDSVESFAGSADDALQRLLDPDDYLVTTQGDAHRVWFEAPPGAAHHLFLDARGYYYEWMRSEWLAEENALSAASVLYDPRRSLRQMAPRFKEVEGEMEELFWSSRFRRTER